MPTERNRYYSAPPSTHNVATQYIWDSNAVITGTLNPITGCFRPLEPTDLSANVEVSGGLSINVGAVAITGNPEVRVSNAINTTGSITLDGSISISGDVSIATKTYTSYISGVTSGQLTIGAGALSWSVAVESGSAYLNGLLLNEGSALNGGGYGQYTSNTVYNIGCTGGRTLVVWEG
jgi:hypothetical protein